MKAEDELWTALNNILAAFDRYKQARISYRISCHTSDQDMKEMFDSANNLEQVRDASLAVLVSQAESPDASYREIKDSDKPDEDISPVIIVQGGRRYIAEWDPDAGYFQSLYALDGLEQHKLYPDYYEEYPGRLYGATHIADIPLFN